MQVASTRLKTEVTHVTLDSVAVLIYRKYLQGIVKNLNYYEQLFLREQQSNRKKKTTVVYNVIDS